MFSNYSLLKQEWDYFRQPPKKKKQNELRLKMQCFLKVYKQRDLCQIKADYHSHLNSQLSLIKNSKEMQLLEEEENLQTTLKWLFTIEELILLNQMIFLMRELLLAPIL